MKTIVALFVTLILAAVSASALAMPCGQATKSSSEALDNQHQMRLHVAEQSPVTFKRSGKTFKLDV